MKDSNYNIFSKLQSNIEDFDDSGVYLVGKPSSSDLLQKNTRGKDGGYYYSQKETLEAIDLACASKFKEGQYDSEGKRKTYLNIVNFQAEVALNQTNVDTSNYIFEPTEMDYLWPVTFMDKRFKEWSDESSYDDLIDDLSEDFVNKGTCVVKRIKNGIERVPLRTLRCTMTAKSLEDAAQSGGYVIIENEMHYSQMKKFKGWKLDGLDKDKSYIFYEQYSLVPRALLVEFHGDEPTEADWDEMVLMIQILLPEAKSKDDRKTGMILFLEQIETTKLEEAHYKRIDGRWLGQGEVEKQLENQIARNLIANLRRRGLLWAVKKIFQSTDDEVQKNLLMEVKDGEVLLVKPNGQLSQVNTSSQHGGDFTADDNAWKENSQQISFSFESASGEAMPSGTPFRLGAILDVAVSKYFKRKQKRFSNFLKRSFFNQILPIFRKENRDEHTLRYAVSDENFDAVKNALVTIKANERVFDAIKRRQYMTFEEARMQVEQELSREPYLFVPIPEYFYDNAHSVMRLNIDEPIAADIETLTTIWQTYMQKGDPRADRILTMILAKKGKNLEQISGGAPKTMAAEVIQPGAGAPTPKAEAPVAA